jgi:Protein of unknown function VcgC/VcgE (DUF2780)
MTLRRCVGIVCVGFIAVFALGGSGLASQAPQDLAKQAASAAANASPELIGSLSNELGSTPEQAAGAAAALFGVAKSRLKPEEFSQIAAAVPGMDSLLKAAPATTAPQGLGGATGLGSVSSAFTKLGLKPEMVSKAVPILTSYVSKVGGPTVGNLLASALK